MARDIAHAKISEIFEQTGKLPQYVKARLASCFVLLLFFLPNEEVKTGKKAALLRIIPSTMLDLLSLHLRRHNCCLLVTFWLLVPLLDG